VIVRDVKVTKECYMKLENCINWRVKTGAASRSRCVENDDVIEDKPVRETRSLTNIYSRCNVAEAEPIDFDEAMNSQV
jgi:hypothetical protein